MTNPNATQSRILAGKTQATRITLLALAFAFPVSLTTAQTAPAKQWDARFGGSDYDIFYSLQQTSDGGYILGGYTLSGISGDKTQPSWGLADYRIVKTDANGVMQWDARFGGSEVDDLFAMQQTSDGGYILGGRSGSGISGDKTQVSQGGYDYWVVKTDVIGVKQWDTRFGGSDDDYLKTLQQTSDGGYIFGGRSTSGASGDRTQSSQGGYDFWIVKTDASGVKQWDTRFGGSEDDNLYSMQQTADGGYILGGWSQSGISGDRTQASWGLGDYWIVKTDANGAKQWDARFGGIHGDVLESLQQTADSGYIIGGWSGSGISGDKTQASHGGSDYWIVKTDANGIKLWDARFGGSDYDFLESVRQTADGGYILGGDSESGISGDKTQASWGLGDYWIVKTDANGVKQWDARFGGSDYDELESLQQTADGGYILGGYSLSGISGDKTQTSWGYSDYWIVKTELEECSSPVNLVATDITGNSAKLSWDESYEAKGYKVRHKIFETQGWSTSTTKKETVTLSDLIPQTQYVWQIKKYCTINPNETSGWSENNYFTTGPLKSSGEFGIGSFNVYPNPFSSSATISFSLDQSSDVTFGLLDLAGRNLRVIFDGSLEAGAHQFTMDREQIAQGMYVLKMTTSTNVLTLPAVVK